MSKYHERVAAIAAKHDWTTAAGIAAGLRNEMKLEDYGTEFQIWQDGVPIDEETARQAIMSEVTSSPMMEEYQRSLREMVLEGSVDSWTIYVEADPTGEPVFEHGDFRKPLSLGEFEVVTGAKEVERRRKRTTKTDIKKEDRARKIKEKLDDTQNTGKASYLAHAKYCGYLVRNTAIRFFAQIEGQYGTSTETQIRGITLPELQEFIDSTGRKTLAGISTHVDTSLEKADEGAGIKATHSDFAKEIANFLNLEWEMDIDDIKRRHREAKADSGLQSIEHWGADRETVLERLTERRRNLDQGDITKAFELGYGSEILA